MSLKDEIEQRMADAKPKLHQAAAAITALIAAVAGAIEAIKALLS